MARRDPEGAIDKIIRDAAAEGKFDDLEGKGKPLVLDPSPDAVIKNLLKEANVKPEWIELERLIERTLAEAETLLESFAVEAASTRTRLTARHSRAPASPPPAAPPRPRPWYAGVLDRLRWSAPPAVLAAEGEEALAIYHRRWEARLARYAEILHRANREIRRYNLLVPLVQRQRALIPVAERLEAFVERIPVLASTDGALTPARGEVAAALLSPRQEESESGARRDIRRAAALQQMRRFGRRPPPIG
jgi:hypothetical protein